MKSLSQIHRQRIASSRRGKVSSKNLIGRVFDKWTVLDKAPKQGTQLFWKCVCQCGRHREISSHRLERSKSKGCLSCQKQKRPFESMYNTLKTATLEREMDFELTYEEFVNFTETRTCHYCEAEIVWVRFGTGEKTGTSPYNLDRKNNDKGYIMSNLVVCCKFCNRIKSSYFSYEEMLELGKTVRDLRLKKAAEGYSN